MSAENKNRSPWVDATRGFVVFGVVFAHIWFWMFLPLLDHYWQPAAWAWSILVIHLSTIGMPVLFITSGMLVSRTVAQGYRNPMVWARSSVLAWLYVVWVLIYFAVAAFLPIADLPNAVVGPDELISQLWNPTTILWFVFALTVYTAGMALVSRLPPWLVLAALTALALVMAANPSPSLIERVGLNAVFFAVGVYGAKWVWRLERPQAWWLILAVAVLGEALTLLGNVLALPVFLAAPVELVRFFLLALVVLMLVAHAVRLATIQHWMGGLGRRTLEVYVLHAPLIWVMLAIPATTTVLLRLGDMPVMAIVTPWILAIAVTLVTLLLRTLLDRLRLHWLFGPPLSFIRLLQRRSERNKSPSGDTSSA